MMRCYLTPVRVAKINNTKTADVGKDVGKEEPSGTVGGNANWWTHDRKQYGDSSKS